MRHERGWILARLKRFPILYGYVAALLLPGGFALLPALAWWHRHRHLEHKAPGTARRRRHRRHGA
ncbi:MAG TPA: hypothetical protein VMU46_17595 [Burkholderiales bacterium]|nr:hypothetical protein [Burkholderiales bacterium]